MIDMSGLLKIKLLTENAIVPKRGSELAIGYDLYANQRVVIKGGERALVSTGISIEIPPGYYGRIAPRSGLAVKNGIDVMAGVIDRDYTGEIFALLYNTDVNSKQDAFVVEAGMRIAQLILERAAVFHTVITDTLAATQRGGDGFGSTGTGV